MKTLYSALFLSDIHFPTHNKAIVGKDGKIFTFIKKSKRKFKKIFQIGDLVCNDHFSAHAKIPGEQENVLETFEMAKNFWTELRTAAGKDAEITFVEGNHELRLERYLVRQAPELLPLNVLTIPQLLELSKNNIKFKPYRQKLVVDGLKVTHGKLCRPQSGNSARAELKKNKFQTGVSGHTHRQGWIKDVDTAWLELGHLADPDPQMHSYLDDGEADWNPGFGIGTCCEDEQGKKHWFLLPVEIKDDCFVVDGVLW